MCNQASILGAAAGLSLFSVALMIAALAEPWYTLVSTIPGSTPAGTPSTLQFLVLTMFDPTGILNPNGTPAGSLPYSAADPTGGFCLSGFLPVCPPATFSNAAATAVTLASAALGLGIFGLIFELLTCALAVLAMRNRMVASKPSASLQAAVMLASFIAVLLLTACLGLAAKAAGSMSDAWQELLTDAAASAPQLHADSPQAAAAWGLGVGAVLLAAGAAALIVLVACCVRANVREERGTRAGGGGNKRLAPSTVNNPVPVRSASYRAPDEERASAKPMPASSKNRPSAAKASRV